MFIFMWLGIIIGWWAGLSMGERIDRGSDRWLLIPLILTILTLLVLSGTGAYYLARL